MKKKIVFAFFALLFLNLKIFANGYGDRRGAHPAESINNVNTLHKLGIKNYKKNGFREALIYFKRILQLKPHNEKALYDCACMNALLGNTHEAIYYLVNLFNINHKWKVKLKSGAEKDFRYIKNNPHFLLYKKFWLSKSKSRRFVRLIKGRYQGTTTGPDTEHRGVIIRMLDLNITPTRIFVLSGTQIGPLFVGKILRVVKHGNLFLIYAKDFGGITTSPGVVTTMIIEVVKLSHKSLKVVGGYFKRGRDKKLFDKIKYIKSKNDFAHFLCDLAGEVFVNKRR